jgi:hypothetical protein|nr:MAG TPA: hypothetical protein [Caudoviricetes sp.]
MKMELKEIAKKLMKAGGFDRFDVVRSVAGIEGDDLTYNYNFTKRGFRVDIYYSGGYPVIAKKGIILPCRNESETDKNIREVLADV